MGRNVGGVIGVAQNVGLCQWVSQVHLRHAPQKQASNADLCTVGTFGLKMKVAL